MRKRGRPPHPDILTPREWQVLTLLRQGLTNEQVAQRLDISPATATYHVSEIISKLNVTTREEAAAWQPPAAPERAWWQRATASLGAALRRAAPLTLAKAAGVAFAAAAIVGLAALAWGLWRTTGDDADPAVQATGTAASTPPPTAQPQATVAPDSERGLLQRGLWKFSVDGGTPSPVVAIEGLSGVFSEETYQLSPDGGWYAARRRTDSGSEILVGPVSGGPPTRVQLDFHSFLLALSPRGETLLLLGAHRVETRMYLLDVATGGLTDVGRYWWYGVQASWSPDGGLLLLVGGPEEHSPRGVYLADAAFSDPHLIMENVVAKAEWSPHGDAFAAVAVVQSSGEQLLIAQPDGTVTASYPVPGTIEPPHPQITWSPDGSKLAYLENSYSDGASTDDYVPTAIQGAHKIHVIDLQTGEDLIIARGVHPAWSPGGDQLAFIAEGELNVVSAQGGEPRRLSAQTMVPSLFSPRWADASTVLVAYAPRVHESIYAVDIDTGQSALLVDGYSPSYSPDGKTIAFVGDNSAPGLAGISFVYTMNSNGTNLHLLSSFSWSDIVACAGFHITWSPDSRLLSHTDLGGTGVVVSVGPPAAPDIPLPPSSCGATFSADSRSIAYFTHGETGNAVAILDLPGDGQPRLVELGSYSAIDAVWSPDGGLIAYRSGGEIRVVPPGGGASSAVATFESSHPYSSDFEWSPDGARIAFLDKSTVRIVKVSDPAQVTSLPRPEGFSDASFVAQPGTFGPQVTVSEPKWSPDGTMIAFTLARAPAPGEDSSITREIYVTPADGSGSPRRLASGQDPQWSPDGSLILFTR